MSMLPVHNSLLPNVSRFFDDDWNSLFDWSNRNLLNKATMPQVNIKETNDEYLVEVAAPGMKKEDFQIELHNNVLTIQSEKRQEHEEKEGESYTRREFSYQSFKRTFNLNERVVDEGNIKANYKDGILSLSLPKKEEAKVKPARVIEIL